MVIESKLDPGRGAVVTVLVQRGTMKVGDALVAGAHWGRVRAMQDYTGKRVKEAGPSEPVEVLGFDSVPEAGEYVRVVENDRRARQLADERGTRLKLEQQARRGGRKVSLETIFDQYARAEVQELALVLKADVSGSLEAFEDEIAKLPQADVQVQVISSGVGGITESDVNLAAASDAVVIGFNVRPVGEAAQRGRPRGRRGPHLLGHLPRVRGPARRHAGHARARGGRGDGRPGRDPRDLPAPRASARSPAPTSPTARSRAAPRCAWCATARSSTTARSTSLRRGADDVREVAAGFECGIVLHNFADIKEGDQLEVYETRQVERTLS